MRKHTLLLAASLSFLGCGGGTQATPPAEPEGEETPPTPEPQGEENPSEATSDAGPAESEAKKQCADLDKGTCKVTQGCAWNDLKKCVEETPQE